MKDIAKPICNLSGSWLKNLIIDDFKYWDIDVDVPFRQIPLLEEESKICPSDWRYREDLLWLKYNHTKIA